jgi:hypothetical protein
MAVAGSSMVRAPFDVLVARSFRVFESRISSKLFDEVIAHPARQQSDHAKSTPFSSACLCRLTEQDSYMIQVEPSSLGIGIDTLQIGPQNPAEQDKLNAYKRFIEHSVLILLPPGSLPLRPRAARNKLSQQQLKSIDNLIQFERKLANLMTRQSAVSKVKMSFGEFKQKTGVSRSCSPILNRSSISSSSNPNVQIDLLSIANRIFSDYAEFSNDDNLTLVDQEYFQRLLPLLSAEPSKYDSFSAIFKL